MGPLFAGELVKRHALLNLGRWLEMTNKYGAL